MSGRADPERTPGHGRYSFDEVERRFLLGEVPAGLTDERRITDRYLTGTSLRLRIVARDRGVVHKLTQKVRPDQADPAIVRITSTYLTASEHAVLAALPAAVLTKTRWRWPVAGPGVVVDVFAGVLDGLVLAEVELADRAALSGPAPVRHPLVLREVSHDDRFSGGTLARASAPPAH